MQEEEILIPEIEFTRNYDSFHFIKGNRPLVQNHVNRLIADPTFPLKFSYSPILVNEKWGIVDGQHRFTAAKSLDIPIYFIVDPDATVMDIKLRNQSQVKWSNGNFVHFYSECASSFDSKDYQLLEDLKTEYGISYTFVFSLVKAFSGLPYDEFSRSLKEGTLKVWYFKKTFEDFLKAYVPVIKGIRVAKTKHDAKKVQENGHLKCIYRDTSALFTQNYVWGAALLFKNDRKKFNSLMEKMPHWQTSFPSLRDQEKVNELFENIINCRMKSTKGLK